MHKKNLLFLFAVLFVCEAVFAQQGVISPENAINAFNEALAQKKIAVEIVEVVNDTGAKNKFLHIITSEPQTATNLKRFGGQQPSIYYDEAKRTFVGIGKGTANKTKQIRTDLIEHGGKVVNDYWKLSDQAVDLETKRKAMLARRLELNKRIIPDLQNQLRTTTGWHPLKRSSLNSQIAKAEKEAAALGEQALELQKKIKTVKGATKSLVSTGVKSGGVTVSRTQRLWNWAKSTKVGSAVGKAGNWALSKLGRVGGAVSAGRLAAKGSIKAAGKILLPVSLAYDAFVIAAPYSAYFTDTLGPSVAVTPDIGYPRETSLLLTDDGKTHVFFNTVIEPNSSLNIRKVEAFREAFRQGIKSDPIAQYTDWVGFGVAKGYEWLADYNEKDGEDQFIMGCNIELYRVDSASGTRTDKVAEQPYVNCLSGQVINQEWVIDTALQPGDYELVVRVIFDPRIIAIAKDDIRAKSHLYEDLLGGVELYTLSSEILEKELAAGGLTPEQIQQTKEQYEEIANDPVLIKIMISGMPGTTGPITLSSVTEKAEGEPYKVKHFFSASKSTGEKKDSFELEEINDLQIWFDFHYSVAGFLIGIAKKDDPESAEDLASEDTLTGPYPNGNPAYQKEGLASYVLDDGQNIPSFNEAIKSVVTEPGVYTVYIITAYFNDETDTVELGDTAAREFDIAFGGELPDKPGEPPEGEELTTGHIALEVTNKDEIEAAGVPLAEYVKHLKIYFQGDLVASFDDSDEAKRIYLKDDKIVINNISVSNKRDLDYTIEWSKEGYKTGQGKITVEATTEELTILHEGTWKEGDEVDW